MAKPIKETPILKGKYAEEFQKAVDKNETDKSNRVSKEEYEKSKELYNKMLANATF